MTPESWRKIEQLYHAALELAQEDRSAFLNQACASDEALRREVESLLSFDEAENQFIESPPGDLAARMLAENQPHSIVGSTLGHYRIISKLGAGGMGEVFLAQDISLGRKVALKVLAQQLTWSREQVQRFKQEARAASALNHPNVITILEVGQVDELYFIATEFIDGQTLRERMATVPMDMEEALDIAIQVAGALAVAHEAGIVHRDIKPENIMLRPDGYIKVLDFGLAKLIEPLQTEINTVADSEASAREQVHTQAGWAMGTPRYMSPEQVRAQHVDGRSDIFSLGIILYEMVAGRRPFDGDTYSEMIAAILNTEALPLGHCSRKAPIELERILIKALAKDREDRYQTAKYILTDLKNLKLELELKAKLRPASHTEQSANPTIVGLSPVRPPRDSAQPSPSSQESLLKQLEPVGGAVPLDSKFYVFRPTDVEFQSAIARHDSIVLVKGARQVGKTSMLARGLERAREAGAKVVVTDFQKIAAAYLESAEKFLLSLAESFADQLGLDPYPDQIWNQHISAGINLERYLRRTVFAKVSVPIVWGLDEVDRLFACAFGSEVFGLFRSWHNERALDPHGPWHRFTLAIAYATEAHLFITDLNQSPFNVGTRLALGDFTFDQVAELNRRYGSALRDRAELARFFRLVGGHPYLVRRGLHEMTAHGLKLADLEAQAHHDEGPFGDHLRRILVSLTQDASLSEAIRGILQGGHCATPESFYRLRSAGLISGDSTRDVRPRCQLYATYLERHLL